MAIFVRAQEIEHPIGPSGRFALRVTDPNVEIRGVDGSTARVRATIEIRASSEEQADELLAESGLRVNAADGSLELSEVRRDDNALDALGRIFGRGRGVIETVEVEVPRGAHVEYDGVSADATATELSGAQRYRTVSGDVVLDRVSGSIRVHGVSGDVSLRADAGVSLDLNTVSGDVSAFAPTFDAVRVVTVSGDVEVEGVLDERASHRVETVSGDLSLGISGPLVLEVRGLSTEVEVNVPHRAEGSRERRRFIVGNGGPQVQFSSMSGDVSVWAPRRAAPPVPSVPPVAPLPPVPAGKPATLPGDEEQVEILRALERGEIDVDEAARRLAGERGRG